MARDLVALSTLPAIWLSPELGTSVQNLAEVLCTAVRARLLYVRLRSAAGAVCEGSAAHVMRRLPALTERLRQHVLQHINVNADQFPDSIPGPDGEERWSVVASPVAFAGQIRGVILACTPGRDDREYTRLLLHAGAAQAAILLQRDESELRRFAQASSAREQEARTEKIMQLMPTAICACDAHGCVTFFNRRLADLLGAAPEIGEAWSAFSSRFRIRLASGSTVAADNTPLMVALRERRSFREQELEITRPDGQRFYGSANIEPMVDRAGDVSGVIMVLQDITGTKRAMRHSEFLARLTQEAALLTEEAMIATTVTEQVAHELGVERCYFAELDRRSGSARVRYEWRRGDDLPAATGDHKLAELGLAPSVGEKAGTTVVNDTDAGTVVPLRAYVAAPYIQNDATTALFVVAQSTTRQWSHEDIAVLEGVVARVWPLVERARASAALQERTRSLEQLLTRTRAAEEASRRLASLVESSDDAIIGVTLGGTITSWNGGAERMFGYYPDEIIGQPVTQLLPADRFDEEPAILHRISRGEHIDHYETVRRRKNGTLIDISLSVSPIKDGDGRIIAASKIARDVTARRRAEARQHALYEMLASVNRAEALPQIYEVALDAILRCQGADRASILLYDDDNVMRFVAWRGLSDDYRRAVEGHSPWNPTEPNPRPVCLPDVAAAHLDPALRCVIEKEGIGAVAFIPLTYENRLIGKFMLYHDAPHPFADDEIDLVKAIASQVAFAIERRKGAQALEVLINERTASLREAIAQMEEFSYSVSHDLRSPVRAMRGYAEALLQDYGVRLDDDGRELLNRIQRNGLRMDRLIQDLLTYSRLTRREIKLEPVSLDKLVPEVLQQYAEFSPEHADFDLKTPLPDVLAHEPSLTQVLSNLLSNAVKFVRPGTRPRVRIRAETKLDHVRLWIEDNGIGIKPEYQHRLFGMFERIHPEGKYEGTGIGLAIVRKAMERMNGHAGVESDGVSGSRFWIQLSAAKP